MMLHAAPVSHRTEQLPEETTSFVGRVTELAMVNALLAASRLVTVTGPGGVGKTRLALRAAAMARPGYRHGVVLADLTGLRDPELLPSTVAGALHLPTGDRSPLEVIARSLRNAQLLLILDTCEHLIDATALFAEVVLLAAPGVTILATSRQPLDVSGESTCPLNPLPLPDDALTLFTQRAAGFAVTEDNRPDVLRLCQRLDGLPLAVERAAARAATAGLAEPELRDSIGRSHDLCTPAEQALWARLSVFDGPLSLAAAEEVCADRSLPRVAVLDTLISLVDKSVVIKTDDGRYEMLTTIREYGARRLAAVPGEHDRVAGRLLHRYLRLAQEFDADPLTSQLSRYRVLRAEHASIRAALRHGFAAPGGGHAATRLVTALYWYWYFSGLAPEAKKWLAVALDRVPGQCAERAGALIVQGLLLTAQGDPAAGLRGCEAGLAMAQASGDARAYARGHLYYCQALLTAGYEQEALTAGRAAASLMPAAGDGRAAELLHVYLGLANVALGNIEQALDQAAEGLSRRPADGEERWAGSVLYAVTGLCLLMTGESARGSAALRESLTACRVLGDPVGLIYGLGLLGFAAAGQGRHTRTAWLLGAARALRDQADRGAFIAVPALARLVRRTAGDARAGLGDDAYSELVMTAARCPIEDSLDLAVSDCDVPALTMEPATGALPRAGGHPDTARSPVPGTAGQGVDDGAAALTERQLQIAALAATGLSNREIAQYLVISKRTVDTHVTHIFGRLGVTSRTQLGAWFRTRS